MDKDIRIRLSCQQFECSRFDISESKSVLFFKSNRRSDEVVCPFCGGRVHVHDRASTTLKDMPIWFGVPLKLEVEHHRYRCTCCGGGFGEDICMKYPGTRITCRAARWVQELLRWRLHACQNEHHAGLRVCHETLIRLQVQAEMDGAQGLGKEGPEDCRQGRQRHADHRLAPSEEGGALQRTRGFLISEEKAPLLQDDGHRLQRFSRTSDVMAILALQHQLQGQVYSLFTPESILMLRNGWPCIGNHH